MGPHSGGATCRRAAFVWLLPVYRVSGPFLLPRRSGIRQVIRHDCAWRITHRTGVVSAPPTAQTHLVGQGERATQLRPAVDEACTMLNRREP